MSYEVVPTDSFGKNLKRLAKKYPKIKEDIKELSKELAETPFTGEALGKNCYKIRIQITGKNTGKSGGARVITYVKILANRISHTESQ